MPQTVTNTATHPLDLGDGTILAVGERATVPFLTNRARQYLAGGRLAIVGDAEREPGIGGAPTAPPEPEPRTPRVIVRRDSIQAIPNASFAAAVDWEYAEEESHPGMWDAGARQRLAAPEWGLYLAKARVAYAAAANGFRAVMVGMNGGTWHDTDQRPAVAGLAISPLAEYELVMQPGDFVTFVALHTQGGALNIAGAAGATWASLHRVAELPYTQRIVALGDSLSEGEDFVYGYVPALRAAMPTTHVLAQGNAGETTTQILARVQSEAVAFRPVATVVLGGTNDLGADRSAAAIQTDLQAIYAALDAAGITAILVTIPPGNFSAPREATRQTVNAWLRGRGRPLVDADLVLRDPADPDSLRAGYGLGDNLHLTPTGNAALAAAIADVVEDE